MEKLLDEFVSRSKEIFGNDLCGVYLHGSAVMGCFNPEKSDIDLIVVVNGALSDETKRAFMDTVVELNASAPKKGIEMSVVRKAVCDPFTYPTPFELHFSAGYIDWYKEDPDDYIREMNGTDKDLAAHFTIIRARGKCLYGLPIEEVFGEVPKRDYIDSLWFDVSGAKKEITKYPTYLILNLARVLAFCEEELVLSKKEGAEWAIGRLPAEFRPLIESALNEYTKNEPAVYDKKCSKKYAAYMLKQISAARKK